MTMRRLGRIYKCNHRTISRLLKFNNVKLKSKSEVNSIKLPEKKIIDLYINNETCNNIADICNSNYGTVRRVLLRNGIKLRSNNLELPEKEIIDLYINNNKDCKFIGNIYNCNYGTIINLLQRNGIELRSKSEILKIRFENPEAHEKASKATSKRFENPEERILQSCRLLGIAREEWDGFRSTYCELWCEELREHIRNKYSRVCFICGGTEEENGQKHSVHHVNYNKDCGCDGSECHLVPLCKRCHGNTTFGDRKMWEDLIMDMLENYDLKL